MKKVWVILCFFVLVGCATRPTFEEYLKGNVDSHANEIEIIKILSQFDFEDASIGLSYIETENNGKTLYFSGLAIDELTSYSIESHGKHEALYLYPGTPEFTWYWNGDPDGNLEEYEYMKLEVNDNVYYAGILKGYYNSVKYDREEIDSKKVSINIDKQIDCTFWVVTENTSVEFDIRKLKY